MSSYTATKKLYNSSGMQGPYFITNGALRPIEEAVVALDDVNFVYGYGVYENIKVRGGVVYFAPLHEERLFHSAHIIALEHYLRPGQIVAMVRHLIQANRTENANLKLLLIGSPNRGEPDRAQLYIMALNPLFPKRSERHQGATAIVVEAERQLPQAKSLNMMISVMSFRRARAAGAYDALLADRRGHISEGTRTNFFVTDGTRIYTPPAAEVLEGVTKLTVAQVIRSLGIELRETALVQSELERWSGAFLTSTSSKIMPLRAIDRVEYEIPPITRRLVREYDLFLERYRQEESSG